MNPFLVLILPLLIFGFVYMIIGNKGLPQWMERLSDNSGTIWTYGIVAITVLSILKYLSNSQMTLNAHRKHKIYIAAMMGYGLGSEDPEEISYYQQVKEEMKKDRENGNLGVSRSD